MVGSDRGRVAFLSWAGIAALLLIALGASVNRAAAC